MGSIIYHSNRFIRTEDCYRRIGRRKWTLVERHVPYMVDIRFVVRFLRDKPKGYETQVMDGNTIVVTTYNPYLPEKMITKFTPIPKQEESDIAKQSKLLEGERL